MEVAFVEAFTEASVKVTSVEVSVEAFTEAPMEAFMSFHQNADSAGGPSSSRAAMKRLLKKIACLGGGGIVESVFSYCFPLRLASNCAHSRYVLPARSLSQQWLVFTVVFFFIFQEFFVYSRLYLVHTAYWITLCSPFSTCSISRNFKQTTSWGMLQRKPCSYYNA